MPTMEPTTAPDKSTETKPAALRTDFRIVNLLTHRSTVIAPFVDAEGFFRTTPHRHGLEAFFAALLTRH